MILRSHSPEKHPRLGEVTLRNGDCCRLNAESSPGDNPQHTEGAWHTQPGDMNTGIPNRLAIDT